MKLIRMGLKNFRCFSEEAFVDINDLTILIGRNDSGKSTLLDALNIFFGEAKIDSDDVCVFGDPSDVRIICEFSDILDYIVIDADYPTNLSNEYLVNSRGNLEIHKKFDGKLKTPKELGIFAKAIYPTAENVNDLAWLKNKELKDRAKTLGVEMSDPRNNTQIRQEIRDYIQELDLEEQEIQLDKEEVKKIWDKIQLYLPAFALFKSDRQSTDQDHEAQDPMKAAVKEAIKEKEEEFNKLSEFVEQQVKRLAEQTVNKISEMDPTLASQLNPQFSAPKWESVFKISLTGDDQIPINKRGSGVRRLILLNFFRAKTDSIAKNREAPNTVYAIEEPETSQHPSNQKLLMQVFMELAEDPDYQVILTTHTPTLARLMPLESLRYINTPQKNERKIINAEEETYHIVKKELGVLPDNNVKLFIGVEGINDETFLKNISVVLVSEGIDVPDIYHLVDKGEVIFFPLGGNNLSRWTSRLAELERPEFFIFDRDTKPPEEPKYKKYADKINARENCKAVFTSKLELENYIHPNAIQEEDSNVKITCSDYDYADISEIVAKERHYASESPNKWEDLSEKKQSKKIKNAKNWLNNHVVKRMTFENLNERDPDGDILSWLEEIKQHVKK